VNVLLTHIGGYPGKYDPSIRGEIYDNPPKLFICGHSHILKVIYDKHLQMLCVNPGAAGKYGFHQVRTLMRFAIDGKEMKDMEVIELR
jgi:predicted phosphodiesterase